MSTWSFEGPYKIFIPNGQGLHINGPGSSSFFLLLTQIYVGNGQGYFII